MTIHFTKMHGLGNDFVVIDATQKPFSLTTSQIQRMADRHFGVGFDQLLIIQPPSKDDVDFDYRIFNSDGSKAGQCGNGARCVGRFVYEHNLTRKTTLKLATYTRQLEIKILEDEQVMVNMGKPEFNPTKIPFLGTTQQLRYPFEFIAAGINTPIELGVVSMGNPHAVLLVDTLATTPVEAWGASISCHASFPDSVNVGFMQIINSHEIYLRVFERGAGETLACGTGACAAVAIGRNWGLLDNDVAVNLPGGRLQIQWPDVDAAIWMTGPAEIVFIGEWLIP